MVIDVCLGLVAPDGLHAVLRVGDIPLIGVADGRNLDIVGRRRVQPVEARVATRADTDPADIDLVIRALSRDHGRASGNRGRFQEITPIEFVRHGTSNSDIPRS